MPNVAAQVTEVLPYRRVVTVTSIGDAAAVTFAFRDRYGGAAGGESMIVVANGDTPLDISVFPFQELYVYQETLVNQLMSFIIEPRAEGR